MNKEYLSFLEWNKAYYGQIQDRVNKDEPSFRLISTIDMYEDYLALYLDRGWINNIKSILYLRKILSYENGSFKDQLDYFTYSIPSIIQGSKPITNNAVEVSELIFKVNLDQHIRLNQNNL